MVRKLFEKLVNDGYNFFTGVPDSGLKPFINDIIESNFKHIIALTKVKRGYRS